MGKRADEDKAAAWRIRVDALRVHPSWDHWRHGAPLRSLLAALHPILRETPSGLLQEFDRFEEGALADSARKLLRHDDPRYRLAGATADRDVLRRAAELLRALDELLFEQAETVGIEAPMCWLTQDGQAYVVPVARAVMNEGGPRTGQSFDRRGLLRHRVIPVRVGDVDVVVECHPDVTLSPEKPDRLFGAALFEKFCLAYHETTDGRFVAISADCDGGIGAAVERQLAAASTAGCDTVLWPELTLPPAEVQELRRRLGVQPVQSGLPPVIVAGSWHSGVGPRHANLAPVLDGRGTVLFRFGKSRRFTFGGLTEDIDVHGMVHVLVTDREIIAFAICKDFCDKARAVPVTDLDVDLALVPSMGSSTTMTAHCAAAYDMKVHFGTRTVVVQQSYPTQADAPAGYLLKAPADPMAKRADELASCLEFSTFRRDA